MGTLGEKSPKQTLSEQTSSLKRKLNERFGGLGYISFVFLNNTQEAVSLNWLKNTLEKKS